MVDTSQLKYPKDFDVNIRLPGSYVWYKGNPTYCESGCPPTGGFAPAVAAIIAKKDGDKSITVTGETIDPNSSDFDARPFYIGYLSTYDPRITYTSMIMRMPRRSQRAGMNANNCASFSPQSQTADYTCKQMANTKNVLRSMLGIYEDDWDKTISLLSKSKKHSAALSNKIAVVPVVVNPGNFPTFFSVFYKHHLTGVWNGRTNKFHFQSGTDEKIIHEVETFLKERGVKI